MEQLSYSMALVTELVFGFIGICLSVALFRSLKPTMPEFKIESFRLAILLLIPAIGFAWLFSSPIGQSFPPFYKLLHALRESPIRRVVFETTVGEAALFAALAGFCEELLFRGVLQRKTGIWIPAIIFALLHFVNFELLLLTFGFGLYFGYAFRRSGNNLLVPSIVHAGYDFAVMLLMRAAI